MSEVDPQFRNIFDTEMIKIEKAGSGDGEKVGNGDGEKAGSGDGENLFGDGEYDDDDDDEW